MPVLRRLAAPAALVAGLLLPAAPSHALDAAGVGKALSARMPALGGASGARVVDVASGRVLFSARQDAPRIPASNEKLFPSAVALLKLGPAATLETSVRLASDVVVDEAGRVRGDLHLVGAGDPSLGDAQLQELAGQVAAAGVTEVDGGVRGDESLFDSRRGGPRTGFAADSDMGGWLGALTWGHGRCCPGGPALVAATRFQAALKREGVTFGRRARVGVLPDAPGTELAGVPSPAMRSLVAQVNTNSDNFYAEVLTKVLGARYGSGGTTAAGLAVVRTELGRFGIRPRMADGSGLSRANRTTPRQVVRLLERMAAQEIAPSWHASMSVFGRTGTLRKRLRGASAAGACFGKTGTIRAVSAVSGYCRRPDGGLTAFSFLSNGVSTFGAKKAEDRLVRVVAQYRPAPAL